MMSFVIRVDVVRMGLTNAEEMRPGWPRTRLSAFIAADSRRQRNRRPGGCRDAGRPRRRRNPVQSSRSRS
jgi:hypothetical protein